MWVLATAVECSPAVATPGFVWCSRTVGSGALARVGVAIDATAARQGAWGYTTRVDA